MTWGIDFNIDLFLSHVSFNSIYEVKYAIEDIKYELQECKEKILMLISGSPEKFVEPEYDILQIIHNTSTELLQEYKEIINKLFIYEKYLEYLEENKIEFITHNEE